MSTTLIDLKHDLICAWCRLHGIPDDDEDGFVSHLSILTDSLPLEDALGDVDRSYYEGFCRDQRVEAEVERLAG